MDSTSNRSRSFALFVLLIAGVLRLSYADVDQVPEFKARDESDEVRPPRQQFKTAEIADAVMGTAHSPIIEHVIPKELQESLLGEHCVDDEQCKAPSELEETPEPKLSAVIHTDPIDTNSQNLTETSKAYKVNCDKRNITGIENFTIQVLNSSQDLMEFLNANGTECSLVLFYTTWCQFSANLAPHFNALPRAFPTMHFLALDASQHSSLSTRFGTVAVPNILLFQGVKPMARFNQTERTLETLSSFITNQTGFEPNPDQAVGSEDHLGPLPAAPVKSIDWLFVFSVLFISAFTLYAILCTDSIHWLIPGQDHEHQE
ncbi:Thioredoxin domain-containing protein 15 [Triplophysa tibetana]|uniref:Thioredoxin domain-containing protein 15 n=1 Tax=Triplophysa tibetana TaxID=1572043 RepID=A0A5A9PFC9_9TELE|nr:Thioredoxin domain-containing protein 15 [Triplophysa tibetana]